MTAPWKISIRSKILAVLCAVVILAVALYLYLASKIFYEDKTLLIYELNQTNVQTLGSDVATYLKRIEDKLRTIAILQSETPNELDPILSTIIDQDEDFVQLGVYKDPLSSPQILANWEKPLDLYGKNATYISSLQKLVPIPYARVIRDGTWVRNITQPGPNQPPLMTIATSVPLQKGGAVVVYADLLLDPLAKLFSREGIAKAYLIDSDGYKLVNSGGKAAVNELMLNDPLQKAALDSKFRSEVRRFQQGDDSYLGSFFKTGVAGTIVGSKIDSAEAFTAARILLRKSLLYGLIVVTMAFLISLFFSHSLTEPILRLVEATRRVAQGDFDLKIPVSSRDELAVLASSFNTMTVDLKTSHEQIKAAQEQLVHSERLAAIGQVARGIHHEFGNFLQTIVGQADLAKLEKDPEKVREKLTSIIHAGERASVIVRNLQAFSRPALVKGEVDLSKILGDALALLTHEFRKKTIQITEKRSPVSTINGNSTELEQVFMNLLINAVHAVPEGGTIEVGCGEDSECVRAWVRDTGTGIPADVLPKIFDHAFTTKGNKGSGLGLSICKGIVENHGGTIEVETSVGNGTTFTVKIPRKAS